ncbi:MAG TPA: CoA transferase [Acidimicrobiales bacterium]|nr:CoA transferase [Acidimicrobiales bacterium]
MPVGRDLQHGQPQVERAVSELVAGLDRYGVAVDPGALDAVVVTETPSCPVLGWAASGAMSLTGWPGEAPQWPGGDVIGRLTGTARLLAGIARGLGTDLPVDVGALLTERAAARGGTRRGDRSMGGRCGLLRTGDSWLALNLARDSDLELLPALTGGAVSGRSAPDVPAGLWAELGEYTRRRRGAELTAAAQLLGLPAAPLGPAPTTPRLPWSIRSLGDPAPATGRNPVVVDFSAMWAGPLCAHLLGRCGLQVVKVEDVRRPDGARRGDPWLFDRLHRHHDQVALDFGSPADRRALRSLVASADVVIESSRPRALAGLGFDPGEFLGARPGRTWVSITGYGRSGPRSNWVAFGDDAAVAGGLVGRSSARPPVFCADAIADPVTGLAAATGALASLAHGGGHLVDCSMEASCAFAVGDSACAGDHRVEQCGSSWTAYHDGQHQVVAGPGRSSWEVPG